VVQVGKALLHYLVVVGEVVVKVSPVGVDLLLKGTLVVVRLQIKPVAEVAEQLPRD